MRNWFSFGGLDSRDFGIYISGRGAFDAPLREYEMISVPGRDGDLVGVGSRLANVDLTYPAYIYKDFREQIGAMKSAFLSKVGYQRLIDTYNPDEFRMAMYAGDMPVEATSKNNAGQFELTFQCKPQRYLLIGQDSVDVTSALSIFNPTSFPSKPLIRIYGYGAVGIGGQTITVANHFAYVDIDCEMADCFNGANNANPYVTFSNNDFPELGPGQNGFTKANTVTQILVTPRWWRV